jgi:hypothetical protein
VVGRKRSAATDTARRTLAGTHAGIRAAASPARSFHNTAAGPYTLAEHAALRAWTSSQSPGVRSRPRDEFGPFDVELHEARVHVADFAAPQLEPLKFENGRSTTLATHVDSEVVRAEPLAQGRDAPGLHSAPRAYFFRSFARAR